MKFRRGGAAAVLGLVAASTIGARAQVQLPGITVTAPSPIGVARPADVPDPAVAPSWLATLPIVTDQFATVTVVTGEELRRTNAPTLGDLLFSKPGITGSSFAPGASSRPIIRGLDVNRVRIQENGIGANGASDLGEDHFVPVDPLTSEQVEVIRGPATLRFGSQAIGGVVEATNNRIPTALPCEKAQRERGCANAELRSAFSSADTGADGAALFDAGGGNVAFHADIFGRKTQDYSVPGYPYLNVPAPTDAPRATQPGAFKGRQPNSSFRGEGGSLGGSYIFNDGYFGAAVIQNNALYGIPGSDGENHNTRIDAKQTKVLTKGEWRGPNSAIDAIRFWGGATDYKHNEIGLSDPLDPASDGVQQIFTNKEQEGRVEFQLAPFDLRFAKLTTALGVQGGHQELNAPSPGGAGLFDPNSNHRVAGYAFNEFAFSPETKMQIAGRVEQVDLSGTARTFPTPGVMDSAPASLSYAPKSASGGLIQNLPFGLVASLTAQYVERAPKPAELFSGGGHDATVTFDKGNANLTIEAAQSFEAGLRRAVGPFRFEATVYYTKFKGFIYRALTGNTCDEMGDCTSPAGAELNEAIYSQRDATFRGGEFQSQLDVAPLWMGMFGIENQFDIVRATFTDGTNVPRIPPMRLGGGLFYRDANWLARVNLLHAFPQNDIAAIGETTTAGYNRLRAELSYTRKLKSDPSGIKEYTVGVFGDNLLNDDMRNSTSYSKDEVLMPGASMRVFANVKF